MGNDRVVPKQVGTRDVEIASRVRSRRLECGLSLVKLAKQIGVTHQQLQKYERATNRIGAGRLQLIAGALGVPVSYFFSDHKREKFQDAWTAGANGSFEFLRTRGATRLIRAFSKIESAQDRLHLIKIAEALADES